MTICHGLLVLMEPDGSVRDALATLLLHEGWQVAALESAEVLAGQLENSRPVAVISESRLPGYEAQSVLSICLEHQVPLIFIGHEQAVQLAVDLVQRGAAGYLEKPFSRDRLLQLLDQLPDRHNTEATRQP
jgi:FixJ family two-component response regulator